MQRVAVVVGVAQSVVVEVEPCQQRVDAQEDAVERLGLEYCAVVQLVTGRREKAAEGAMHVERQREADPGLLQKQVVGERRSGGEQRQVTQRLQPALQVAAPHQMAQHLEIDRTAIPAHAHGAGNLFQRWATSGHSFQNAKMNNTGTSASAPAPR